MKNVTNIYYKTNLKILNLNNKVTSEIKFTPAVKTKISISKPRLFHTFEFGVKAIVDKIV